MLDLLYHDTPCSVCRKSLNFRILCTVYRLCRHEPKYFRLIPLRAFTPDGLILWKTKTYRDHHKEWKRRVEKNNIGNTKEFCLRSHPLLHHTVCLDVCRRIVDEQVGSGPKGRFLSGVIPKMSVGLRLSERTGGTIS